MIRTLLFTLFSLAIFATKSQSCLNPILLTDGQVYNGNTSTLSNGILDFNCSFWDNDQDANEAVHQINITQTGSLTIYFSKPSGKDMRAWLTSSCDASTCIERGASQFTVDITSTGTYYIIVDGDGVSDVGAYTLQVAFPKSPTANGTCSNPITLQCGQVYQGNTGGYPNQIEAYSCNFFYDYEAGETVHTITLPNDGDLTINLTDQNSIGLEAYVLRNCNDTACITSGNGTFIVSNLTAGTYYILVDGDELNDVGGYSLTATCPVAPSSSGTCNDPVILNCGVKYTGNTTGFPNNMSTYACGFVYHDASEVVHKINITESGTMTVNFNLLVSKDIKVNVLTACHKDSCILRDNGVFTVNVTPGDYYLVVDGDVSTDIGAYELTVTCPVNANSTGTCNNPVMLQCGQTYQGNTTSYPDVITDYNCNIIDNDQDAGEVVHYIQFQQSGDVTIDFQPNGSQDMRAWLTSACDANTCEGRGIGSFTINNVQAGNYFIIVDGDVEDTDFGAYELTVTACPSQNPATINERELNNHAKIYPNPTLNNLFVEVSDEIDILKVEIYDLQGKIINSIENSQYVKKLNIDVKEIPHGEYIIKIICAQTTFSKFFIKQ